MEYEIQNISGFIRESPEENAIRFLFKFRIRIYNLFPPATLFGFNLEWKTPDFGLIRSRTAC
jgi:hypothetical protein